jgi:hypothetical protein
MATWHATLTYTLAVEPPDPEALTHLLHAHDGTAHVDGSTLTVDVFVRSAQIDSLQSAARLAGYIVRRAIFAAGVGVATENGLTVVLAPALDGAQPAVRAEPA